MAARSSKKKPQADLISLVKSAGWKEDQAPRRDELREWKWFNPRLPRVFYRLSDAADLIRAKSNAMTHQDLGKIVSPPN
jgi:hypothetical protein